MSSEAMQRKKNVSARRRLGHAFLLLLMILVLASPGRGESLVELTDEERDYLERLGPITVCPDPDWAPFEFLDEAGNFAGIAADLLNLLAERLGIEFTYVIPEDWPEAVALSKAGDVLILPFLNQTPAREQWLVFTEPLLIDPNVFITREEHPFIYDVTQLTDRTIVFPEGTSMEERVRRDFPNLQVVTVETEEDVFRAVDRRKADMTLRSLTIAAYTIRKEGFFNLKVAGQAPEEYVNRLRMGILKSEPRLRDILNRGIATITPREREEIVNRHVFIKVQTVVDYKRIYAVAVFFSFLLAIALYWQMKLRGLNRTLAERQEKLLELSGRLKRHSEHLRLIIDTVPNYIFAKDADGHFLMVNKTAADVFHMPPEDVVGRTSRDYGATEEEARRYEEEDRNVIESGETLFIPEERLIRKDGSYGWFQTTKTPYVHPDFETPSILGVSVEITDRREAEKALRLAMAEAEAANRAKSDFLANMSHEIRTPMNGVLGMIELLLDSGLGGEQLRFAETARTSAKALLALLNDILDISKIEAGKLDLESVDFDLELLLDDFAESMAMQAREKKVEFLCAADPDVPRMLRGDPGRLRQILTNLAGNAVKFTDEGDVLVRVSLVDPGEEDVLLRFSVRDTGVGIPGEKQALLFRKFSQLDASTTRRYGGTGLGLAISRELVEMMGGEIGVKSPPENGGTGSEFLFTARFTLAEKRSPPQAASSPDEDLSGVRILIVDDNTANREILHRRFIAWGMNPSEARDGEEALRLLFEAHEKGDPFRLAVIDMQMPGMNGETLGKRIKAEPSLSETGMVMLTSLASRGDARRFADAGFAAYLSKPVRTGELHGVLRLALENRYWTESERRPILTRHTVRERMRIFNGEGARVLLVEDNMTNRQVALGVLNKLNLSIEAAGNGKEAVEAFSSRPFDLILMDVQMPVMDGIEATMRIRSLPHSSEGRNVPIVAMTAHAMQGDRERFLEAGMNDYLSKPLNPQELIGMLKKWLPGGEKAGWLCEGEYSPAPLSSESEEAVSVWERELFMERLLGDRDFAGEILRGFLADMPLKLKVLKTLVEAGDSVGIRDSVHAIKGAASNVNAVCMSRTASEMERTAAACGLGSLPALLETLESAFEEFSEFVQAYL